MAAGKFDGFAKQGSDAAVEAMIEEHCRRYDIDALDAVKMFTILSRRQWLKRFLAHVEMFKLTLDVPGDIAEVGVFRGHGLFTWANLLESYCIGDRTKVVYGFDNWSGFSQLAPEDGAVVKELEKHPGGFSPRAFYDELRSALEIFDADRFIPWKGRVKLIEGNVEETAARFTEENLGVRFSLIHMDCDLYRPTKTALAAFWPRLSRGGVLLLDEYAIKEWPGETRAVDEFFAGTPEIKVRTLPWTNAPAGYVIKQ